MTVEYEIMQNIDNNNDEWYCVWDSLETLLLSYSQKVFFYVRAIKVSSPAKKVKKFFFSLMADPLLW